MTDSASMTELRKPTLAKLVAEADALYRYALPRVRGHHAAEDLVQETLVTAVKKFSEFQGRAALGTWLTGILRNKILEYLRHQKRHPSAPADDDGDTDPTAAFYNDDGAWRLSPTAGLECLAEDPAQLVQRAEIRAAVQHCLDRLPLTLRSVFVLREVEGCATDEIGRSTGVGPGSVAVLLHRARQLLRTCLQKTWVNA